MVVPHGGQCLYSVLCSKRPKTHKNTHTHKTEEEGGRQDYYGIYIYTYKAVKKERKKTERQGQESGTAAGHRRTRSNMYTEVSNVFDSESGQL